jgi:hypothetical protein
MNSHFHFCITVELEASQVLLQQLKHDKLQEVIIQDKTVTPTACDK